MFRSDFNVKIFAFGKAGSAILNLLSKQRFPTGRLFYFDTDKKDYEKSSLSNRFLLGNEIIGGVGTAGNRAIGREVFDSRRELFEDLVADNCLYILVGGFGGGTFSAMACMLASILSDNERKFLIVSSLPHEGEEGSRMANALDALQEVNHYTDKVILMPKHQTGSILKDNGLANGYASVDSHMVKIITELLTDVGSTIINGGDREVEKLHDNISRIKAYIDGNELFVTHYDAQVIMANTHDALLTAIEKRPEDVYMFPPRKFEELIAHIYRIAGHQTELTKATRDGGVDIKVWTVAPLMIDPFLTVVQAKQVRKSPIGVAAVRDLEMVRQDFAASKGVLVTTGTFSKDSIAYARGKGARINLIHFFDLTQEVKQLRNK